MATNSWSQTPESSSSSTPTSVKSDKLDAENLARLARVDPKLLYPLEHRSERSQAHLALLHSREVLVRSRTQLINHVRGTVKSFGHRLPKCSASSFPDKVADGIPELLREALEPILKTIASLSARIRDYERKLETLAQEHYSETELLRQVQGVGALTALAFVLTLEDPDRFEQSRAVGAYLWDWCRARTNRANTIPKGASPERATRC